MAARHKVSFEYLDELRADLGLFISDTADFLGISERTWFRWADAGQGPKWSLVALRSLTGDLAHLGWKGWYIKRGRLYNDDLNPRYYHFTPAHLLISAYCPCEGHQAVRRVELADNATSTERRMILAICEASGLHARLVELAGEGLSPPGRQHQQSGQLPTDTLASLRHASMK